MSNYWQDRLAQAQLMLSRKKEKEIEKQLRKYYLSASKKVIEDFESTYNKLLATMEDGKVPTPADLYKLDKYWTMQAQIKRQLNNLGNKTINLLSKQFQLHYFDIYYSFALEGKQPFNTIDEAAVRQLINSSWVLDGKNFSQRIWNNTERLLATLNDELIHIVATGKKTTNLKQLLQERFDISYRRADTLVRTEVCHIQTEAAKQRYKDYGIQYVEVLVDEDDRTCDLCKAINGKKFLITEASPLPLHPNERCCLVPVVE